MLSLSEGLIFFSYTHANESYFHICVQGDGREVPKRALRTPNQVFLLAVIILKDDVRGLPLHKLQLLMIMWSNTIWLWNIVGDWSCQYCSGVSACPSDSSINTDQ